MAVGFGAHSIQGRSTACDDSPGATKLGSYVTSAGVETKEPQALVRLINNSGGALVKNQVVLVEYTGLGTTNPGVITVAAKTPNYFAVVATEAVAASAFSWFVFQGYVDALVEGTTDVAVGDFLKLVAGTSSTGFIKDGTAKTTKSFAIAHAAQATDSAVAAKVYLFGETADPD